MKHQGYISFVLIPKPNIKVWPCLDPAMLNQTFIMLIQRGPTINEIFQELMQVPNLTLINTRKGYHNLKPVNKYSYLTTFVCQFGRCRYTKLPLDVCLAGDMFQRKIDETFKELPGVFGIADDNLIVGYDRYGTGKNKTLCRVLHRCRKENLKVNRQRSFHTHLVSLCLETLFLGMGYYLIHMNYMYIQKIHCQSQ